MGANRCVVASVRQARCQTVLAVVTCSWLIGVGSLPARCYIPPPSRFLHPHGGTPSPPAANPTLPCESSLMKHCSSVASALLLCCIHFCCIHSEAAHAQQQPAVDNAPFQLNKIEQAYLDQLLANWEQKSKQIKTFRCNFQRWEYNPVFGPNMQIPFRKNQGEMSFQKPDRGSFQITQVNQFQPPNPQGPGAALQKAQWLPQPNIVGEHWVCDGKSIFEYRHEQKQLVVRPIPPEMQGQAIVDGPLPFLFGAEAEKLKKRYWLKVDDQAPSTQIWLIAYPKFQADAANYRYVRLSLERASLLPQAMEMHLPDGSRHTYIFSLEDALVNAPLDRFKNMFSVPPILSGWKRVVEPPPRQAQQPGGVAR